LLFLIAPYPIITRSINETTYHTSKSFSDIRSGLKKGWWCKDVDMVVPPSNYDMQTLACMMALSPDIEHQASHAVGEEPTDSVFDLRPFSDALTILKTPTIHGTMSINRKPQRIVLHSKPVPCLEDDCVEFTVRNGLPIFKKRTPPQASSGYDLHALSQALAPHASSSRALKRGFHALSVTEDNVTALIEYGFLMIAGNVTKWVQAAGGRHPIIDDGATSFASSLSSAQSQSVLVEYGSQANAICPDISPLQEAVSNVTYPSSPHSIVCAYATNSKQARLMGCGVLTLPSGFAMMIQGCYQNAIDWGDSEANVVAILGPDGSITVSGSTPSSITSTQEKELTRQIERESPSKTVVHRMHSPTLRRTTTPTVRLISDSESIRLSDTVSKHKLSQSPTPTPSHLTKETTPSQSLTPPHNNFNCDCSCWGAKYCLTGFCNIVKIGVKSSQGVVNSIYCGDPSCSCNLGKLMTDFQECDLVSLEGCALGSFSTPCCN
jgi:hypothetical protein